MTAGVAPALFTLTNVGLRTAAPANILSSTVRAPAVSAPVAAPATQPPLTAPLDWSAGYAVLPADPTEYRLNNAGQLLRRPPGGTWTVLADEVRSFQQGRNGDLYLLTEEGELKRFQLGYAWSTLQTGVQAFHIDPFGTVFVRNRLNTLIAHSATHEYYVLPAIPPGTEHFSQDPPFQFEPVHAAGIDAERSGGQGRWEWPYSYLHNDIQYFPADPDGFPLTNELVQLLTDAGRPVPDPIPRPANPPTREFDTSYFNNVRMVIEPIVDRVDSPRLFPGVGLAQLHHVEYKVTVYSGTLPAAVTEFSYGRFEQQVDIVFISHDHLHLVEPVGAQAGTVTPPAVVGGVPPSSPSSTVGSRGSLSIFSPRILGQGLEAAQMMITAPDGTIYLPGRGQSDIPILGTEAAPYFLRMLAPNGLWKPLDFALNHAIGPDSRLYILNPNHELRTPALGPTKWVTLATNVRAFVLDAAGTLFVLDQHGDLRRRTAGAADWTPAERGVASLMISPQGTVYSTTDRGELRRLNVAGRWTVLEQGLRGHAMVSDGTVYALNGRGQLIRLIDQGERKVLATGLQALQVAPDGGVHVLTDRQELRKLTARDHWTVLHTGVRRFQIAANGDLYLLTLSADLRRLKAGSAWETLQGNVRSFNIDTDGSVAAYDHRPMPTIYSSLGRHFVLSPGNPDTPGTTRPPNELDILFAAHLRTWFTIYDRNPENANDQVDRLDEASGRPMSGLEEYSPFAPILPTFSDREQPQLRFSSVTYSAPVLIDALDEFYTISTERIADRLEPVRFVPGLGPAQLHRAGFKATITLTRVDGTSTRELMVYLDRDHYHLAGNPLELP